MNIKNYASYFHDGSIVDVKFLDSQVVITMSSAQISEDENLDHVPLGRFNMIRGKLHLLHINLLKINDKISDINHLIYNDGEIFKLSFKENKVSLLVEWLLPNNDRVFQDLEFTVENYYFENLPELIFPDDDEFDEEGRYTGPL